MQTDNTGEHPKPNPPAMTNPSLHEDMQREISASERRYQQISKGVVHSQDGAIAISEEIDAPYLLDRMRVVAKRIARGNESAIEPITGKGLLTYGRFKHKLTSLGSAILVISFEAIPLIEKMYPACRREDRQFARAPRYIQPDDPYHLDDLKANFNPFISVMLRACQQAIPTFHRHGGTKLDVDATYVIKAFNRLLCFVRRVCRNKKFKRIVNDYTRGAQKNLRSCCHYMAAAFAQHSRLLILRVDLYITPDHKAWATTDAADKCIRCFLRALRENRIVPDVKAWICKRENGFRRGIHCHVLVAMDGHKHQEAGNFSRQLGEAWKNHYSDGHGSYFNCWARRQTYSLNCLGSVHMSNRMMLMGLREAIKYITKVDCQMRTGHTRNLWRGTTSKSWNAVKRGAPRKAQNTLALVSEILGDV